jgi:phosphohistidine swiveling domain-containing protein
VRDRLLGEKMPAPECLATLEAEPAARPFLDGLAEFLDEFGWRTGLFEFAEQTWIEDPTVPLDQLRAYMQMPGYDPIKEQERLAADREEALRETLERLEPEPRERLRAVVEATAEIVSIQEDHNYYIDQRIGMLPRRLILAAGRRLVSTGALAKADDVFYLRHGELCSALRGEVVAASALAGTRKLEMERWSKVTPPANIGAPPVEDDSGDRFWGTKGLRSDRPNELKGSPASPGVGRGPARVLHSLDESHRLQPGDVLVTRTTMPPWTPLFAVASAVVTETGGVLSHAAVTAREFRLPAVLSVENATTLLRDGQLIEVDGEKGIVKILN